MTINRLSNYIQLLKLETEGKGKYFFLIIYFYAIFFVKLIFVLTNPQQKNVDFLTYTLFHPINSAPEV